MPACAVNSASSVQPHDDPTDCPSIQDIITDADHTVHGRSYTPPGAQCIAPQTGTSGTRLFDKRRRQQARLSVIPWTPCRLSSSSRGHASARGTVPASVSWMHLG